MLKRGKNEKKKEFKMQTRKVITFLKDCTSNIQENFYERDRQTDRETLKNLSDFPFCIR